MSTSFPQQPPHSQQILHSQPQKRCSQKKKYNSSSTWTPYFDTALQAQGGGVLCCDYEAFVATPHVRAAPSLAILVCSRTADQDAPSEFTLASLCETQCGVICNVRFCPCIHPRHPDTIPSPVPLYLSLCVGAGQGSLHKVLDHEVPRSVIVLEDHPGVVDGGLQIVSVTGDTDRL